MRDRGYFFYEKLREESVSCIPDFMVANVACDAFEDDIDKCRMRHTSQEGATCVSSHSDMYVHCGIDELNVELGSWTAWARASSDGDFEAPLCAVDPQVQFDQFERECRPGLGTLPDQISFCPGSWFKVRFNRQVFPYAVEHAANVIFIKSI